MHLKFIIFIAFSILTYVSFAQRPILISSEIIIGLGASNFLGDLGGSDMIGSDPFSFRDLNFSATKPVGSIAYRYRFDRTHAIRVSVFYGYLSGNDAYSDEYYRNYRNIHFRTPVVELAGQYDLMINRQREGYKYKLRGIKGWRFYNIDTYFFAGLGAFWFSSEAKYPYDRKWHKLSPLSTEGQGLIPTRKRYSPVQITIPLGIGFKYGISEKWGIGLEYGIRKTFTDYMDDTSTTYFDNNEIRRNFGDVAAYFADPNISITDSSVPPTEQTAPGEQRGNPTNYDSYMFATFTITYSVSGYRSREGTPKFVWL